MKVLHEANRRAVKAGASSMGLSINGLRMIERERREGGSSRAANESYAARKIRSAHGARDDPFGPSVRLIHRVLPGGNKYICITPLLPATTFMKALYRATLTSYTRPRVSADLWWSICA